MGDLERLIQVFDEAIELLYSEELAPDRDRSDWSAHRERVDALVAQFEAVAAGLDGLRAELDDESVNILERRLGQLGFGVFAVLHASGQAGRALLFLGALAERGPAGETAELLKAADRDPSGACALAALRHRIANDDLTARPALKQLAKTTSEQAIRAAALEMFHAPRPLGSAPPLWRINGFGVGLYGSRDREPDHGSEIKTLCLSALWVPVMPLSAYRVIDQGDGAYLFLSKNRLSKFARAARLLVVAGVTAAIAFFAVSSYLSSPDRLAGKELAAADAARDAGDTDGAIARYDQLVKRFAQSADRELVASAVARATRLRVDRVPTPLTAAELPAAMAVIRAYQSYPGRARTAASGDALFERALVWSDELERDGAPEAAATFLAEAVKVAPPDRERPLQDRLRQVRTRLAAELSPRRPVDALATLIELGALDQAGELIASIRPHLSLVAEAEPLIATWLARSDDAEVRTALDRARAMMGDKARSDALASGDRATLEAALGTYPNDHDLSAAIAELDRAAGEAQAAIDRLSALGEPGWLTASAQQTLAAAHADAGALDTAGAILGDLLRYRMPAFQRASSAYNQAAEALRVRLDRMIQAGSAPAHIMRAVQGSDEAAAYAAVSKWASEQMSKDANLARLRDEYQRHGYVVAASLALGTITLRRANQTSGEAREALLAEAERAFLAISADAVGLPSYHLGLGQVYHRLGKTAQGNAELDGLLSRGDFEIDLAVSSTYRELGIDKRAKEIAEQVYERASSPMRENAASLLSFIVTDLDEKVKWLERADSSSPAVKAELAHARATQAAQRGDDATAARLFREVVAFYEQSAAHSSASANNAAIAHQSVYAVTGDRGALARARAGLEAALRLEPSNALVIGNLASHARFEGWLAVLARELPVTSLRLDTSDATALAGQLAPNDAAFVERAAANPLLRRSFELTAQETLLAPSSSRGWERATGWATMRRDVAALEALAARIARAEIDISAAAERWTRWVTGELDELAAEQTSAEIARHERMLSAAQKARSRRGEAAARYLLGTSLASRGWSKADVASLEQALAHLEAARAAWPDLGDTSSSVALQLAIVRAAKKSPVVKSMRADQWRHHSATTMLIDRLLGDSGEPIRAALAADPAVKSTAAWLASAGDSIEPEITHWVIGVLAGNAPLAARGAASLRQRHNILSATIGAKLNPKTRASELLVRLYANPALLDR